MFRLNNEYLQEWYKRQMNHPWWLLSGVVPGPGYQQMTPKQQQSIPTPNSYPGPVRAANTVPNANFGGGPQSPPSQGYARGPAPQVVGAVNPQRYGQPPLSNAPMSFTGPPGVASPSRTMFQQSPPQAPVGARMMMSPGGQMSTPPRPPGGQAGMMPTDGLAKSQSSPLPSSQPPPGGTRMSSPPTMNGLSSPQSHMSQPPVRGGAPPMMNGPAQIPPTSRMQGPPPPRVGEVYQKPASMPPASQHFQVEWDHIIF